MNFIFILDKDKIENSNKWAIPDGFNLNEELLGIRSHIKSEHKGFASPPKSNFQRKKCS